MSNASSFFIMEALYMGYVLCCSIITRQNCCQNFFAREYELVYFSAHVTRASLPVKNNIREIDEKIEETIS